MSGIEKAAARVLTPTLGGTPIDMSTAEQVAVARWAALKSLVYSLRKPNPGCAITSTDLHDFFLSKRAPTDFRVWLSHYPGHSSTFLVNHVRDNTWSPYDFPGFPSGTPHAQTLALVYGDLVVQTVFVSLRARHVPAHYERPTDDSVSIRVWPAMLQTIHWPPQVALTDQTWGPFANTGIGPIVGVADPPSDGPTPHQ